MNKKTFIAIIAGNVLEFYDFMLFAHLAVILGPVFFPQSSDFAQQLMVLSVFVLGFLARPVGAVIFGIMSDKSGRKTAISNSLLFMTLPTFVIAFLPAYSSIGILAPIVMLLARVSQGIALGGEYVNSGILFVETAKKRPCFFSSILCASCQIGSIVGLGLALIILGNKDSQYFEYLWRLPFLIGGIMGLLSYRLRRVVAESPEYIKIAESKKSTQQVSYFRVFDNMKNFGATLFLGALSGVLIWTPLTFTKFYVTGYLNRTDVEGVKLTMWAVITYILVVPTIGFLSDKAKLMKLTVTFAVIVLFAIFPVFSLLVNGHFIMFQITAMVLAGLINANIHAVMMNLFPLEIRGRAISLAYSLGVAIFGSTATHIFSWLIENTGSHYSPAIYVSFLALSTGFILSKAYKVSKMRLAAA